MFTTDDDPAATVLPHLAHDRFLAAMRAIESLPPSARGAFVVGTRNELIGTILIEANRVCWGAAPGMSGRLRDILRSHCTTAGGDEALEEVYQRCRRDSQPLVEALADSGLVTPDRLRAALKQHTIESLLAVDATVACLCGGHALEWPMQWIEHDGRGYNPRYTFAPVEVLEGAGMQRLPESQADLMLEHLEGLADRQNALVAFSYQPDGTPIFIGASTRLSIDLRDLIDLTSWADAALGASPGFSPEVARACARMAVGGAVAWRYEGQSCAALCLDSAALQRLTTNLGRRSLAMVLATRNAVLERVRERTQANKHGE